MKQTIPLLSLLLMPVVSAAGSGSDATVGLAILGGIFGIFMAIMVVAVLVSIFWIWMIVDCATRDNFKADNDKVIWILVLVFAGIIGAIIYYFVIKRSLDPVKHKKKHR